MFFGGGAGRKTLSLNWKSLPQYPIAKQNRLGAGQMGAGKILKKNSMKLAAEGKSKSERIKRNQFPANFSRLSRK